MNDYFENFSALRSSTHGILLNESVKVSNGAYALIEGFEDDVIQAYPSENTHYEWVYNPKKISEEDLMFEFLLEYPSFFLHGCLHFFHLQLIL